RSPPPCKRRRYPRRARHSGLTVTNRDNLRSATESPNYISGAKRPARSRPRSHWGTMGWRSKPIAADRVPCGKTEKRSSSSGAERCRIDVETERCRERRAAQARAQSEGIVARIAYAPRYGPEIAGQYVAVLFREVRIGVIEAELEHAVAERQAGVPVGKVRQRKPAARGAHAAAARGRAGQPAAEIKGQRPAHVGGKQFGRQIERERAGCVGAPRAGLPDVGRVGEGRCQRDLVGQLVRHRGVRLPVVRQL